MAFIHSEREIETRGCKHARSKMPSVICHDIRMNSGLNVYSSLPCVNQHTTIRLLEWIAHMTMTACEIQTYQWYQSNKCRAAAYARYLLNTHRSDHKAFRILCRCMERSILCGILVPVYATHLGMHRKAVLHTRHGTRVFLPNTRGSVQCSNFCHVGFVNNIKPCPTEWSQNLREENYVGTLWLISWHNGLFH